MGLKLITLLTLGSLGLVNALSSGTFIWPSMTQQCETYNVTIYDGVPPWTLVLAPIGGQPIYWDITAPPRYTATSSVQAQIPLQIPIGTSYVVFMQDSSGYFTGVNPTQIQMVGLGSNSDCLVDVVSHSQDFTFTVAGSTTMCEANFEISWLDQVGTGPYNFTVLPLDSSSNPWDQELSGTGITTGASSWAVNMTTGTRFTIMMNNGYGYGAGGIGGIYQVAEGSTNSCISSPMYATAAWPNGLATSAILENAQLPTSVITSRSARASDGGYDLSGDEGIASDGPTSSRQPAPPVTVVVTTTSSGGLSTGAIAGIAAGVGALALVAIGAGIWFCLRKRKNRGPTPTQSTYAAPVDLNDDSGHGARTAFEPKIVPYPSPPLGLAPEMAYSQSSQSFSHSNVTSPDPDQFAQYGMATAAAGQQQQNRSSMAAYGGPQISPNNSGDQQRFSTASTGVQQVNSYFPSINNQEQSGPGQAGPLPSKANIARHSYLPAAQPYGSTGGGLSPGAGSGSVSGSSSSGRGLPMPPGMSQLSESGAGDSKTDLRLQSDMNPQAPTQGHEYSPVPQEPVFNIHRDAEAGPVPQGGTIDLPPMYNDVPQRREGGSAAQ